MELWDVYDKKGRKTGALKEKEADYRPGEYHLAVELGYLTAAGKF